jgi:TonB family protein
MCMITKFEAVGFLFISIFIVLVNCTVPPRSQIEFRENQDIFPDSSQFVKVDIQPILLKDAKAIYPEYARQRGIFGDVWVKILIDTSGNVVDAIIAKDSGSNVGFEKSALEAARRTVWKPAMSDGKPIAVWVTFKTTFSFH